MKKIWILPSRSLPGRRTAGDAVRPLCAIRIQHLNFRANRYRYRWCPWCWTFPGDGWSSSEGDRWAPQGLFLLGRSRGDGGLQSFDPVFETLQVRKVSKDLRAVSDRDLAGLLKGVFLAVAATDDGTSMTVSERCAGVGHPLQQCQRHSGDVVLPAVTKERTMA